MITLVGTPEPEPLATGGVVTGWTLPSSSGCVIPWLRLDRKNTVPLGTSVASDWINLVFPGEPRVQN